MLKVPRHIELLIDLIAEARAGMMDETTEERLASREYIKARDKELEHALSLFALTEINNMYTKIRNS